LAWIKVNDVSKDGLQSPIVKNIHDAIADILDRTGAQKGYFVLWRRQPKSSTTASVHCV
jgi:hypothetical protein